MLEGTHIHVHYGTAGTPILCDWWSGQNFMKYIIREFGPFTTTQDVYKKIKIKENKKKDRIKKDRRGVQGVGLTLNIGILV